MRVPDLFRLNDMPLRTLALISVPVLLAYDGALLLTSFPPFDIMVHVLGFLVLTFLPGFLILRVLGIHLESRYANVVLAVGLSLASVMLAGMAMNLLLPLLGLARPITLEAVVVMLNVLVLGLLALAYVRKRELRPGDWTVELRPRPLSLAFMLLPLLSVIGALWMNAYGQNLLNVAVLVAIAAFPTLLAFRGRRRDLYPLMIFSVSLSVLLVQSLSTMHLWSYDIFYEAYTANTVVRDGVWNFTSSFGATNSLLLIAVLAPIYSLACQLSLVWVFKLIFPLLFALAPLVLYLVYQQLTLRGIRFNEELAALSVVLFIFFYGFFKDMPDKQHLAELFLAMILLLAVTKMPHRNVAFVLLAFAMVTSHYGVSFIFIISLVLAAALSLMFRRTWTGFLSLRYIALLALIAVSWYALVASGFVLGSLFDQGVHVLESVLGGIGADNRSAISYALYEGSSFLYTIIKICFFALIGLIALGGLSLIRHLRRAREWDQFSLLMLASLVFLVIQVAVTYGGGFDRILQITLVLVSPLAVLGALSLSGLFRSASKSGRPPERSGAVKGFALFLSFLFFMTSGAAFVMIDATPPGYSIALTRQSDFPVYEPGEVDGVQWLKDHHGDSDVAVFNSWTSIKSRDGLLLSEYFPRSSLVNVGPDTKNIPPGTFVYVGKGSMSEVQQSGQEWVSLDNTTVYRNVLDRSGIVYANEDCTIYYVT